MSEYLAVGIGGSNWLNSLAGVITQLPTRAVNCLHRYLKTSNVRPLNDHVSYLGDQSWHVSFPSPHLTPNHNPTSSGSVAESNYPLDKMSTMKHDLQYLSKAMDWWESKCDIHGQVMGNLANKLNKTYAGEVKQTLKAISRSKELESLKLKLEETKKYNVQHFTKSEDYNYEMVECFNNGFEMFRDYMLQLSHRTTIGAKLM
ncbi:unnamed protein product [Prunus armeniaca]